MVIITAFYLYSVIVSKARLLQLEDEFHYLQNANANVAATATSAATSPVPSAPPAAEGSIADGEQARK